MPDVTVKGIPLSSAARQVPRIIVPIMAGTAADACAQAAALAALPQAQLVELRLDPLLAAGIDPADLPGIVQRVGAALRADQPLLATLRTAHEGGQADLAPEAYAAALLAILQAAPTERPDLVDIEFSAGEITVAQLRGAARAAGAATVFSEHHFDGTPPVEVMQDRLCAMADAGADIIKLAVMPHSAQDTAALLAATAFAAAARPGTPRITMAMGPLGAVSRVCGGAFGSCATFGAAGQTSAPGQPDAAALARALAALEACL